MIGMKKPKIEQFVLNKLKLTSDGGVAIEWEQHENEFVSTYKQVSRHAMHPDMAAVIQSLDEYVAAVFSLDRTDDNLTTTGLKVSGEGQSKGVILFANVESLAGVPMSISTHKIKYQDGIYGFEEALAVQAASAEREAYLYLFEGKRSQLSLAFDEEKE